jgi:hypothetical protein
MLGVPVGIEFLGRPMVRPELVALFLSPETLLYAAGAWTIWNPSVAERPPRGRLRSCRQTVQISSITSQDAALPGTAMDAALSDYA